VGGTRPHRLPDGGQHQIRVLQGRKRHEVDAVEEVVCECPCHMLAESCLSDTGWSGYRQQPDVVSPQEARQHAYLMLAPDEAGQREGPARTTSLHARPPRRIVSQGGDGPPGSPQLRLVLRRQGQGRDQSLERCGVGQRGACLQVLHSSPALARPCPALPG
jgi:hypothetical protein